jgi:hypothetical protein
MYTFREVTGKPIEPTTLYSILRNIWLYLPESYELVTGTTAENVRLYYELVKIAVIRDHTVLNWFWMCH